MKEIEKKCENCLVADEEAEEVRKMAEVPKELLRKAYKAGRKLWPEYPENLGSEGNRLMELAFIWGVLGYPFAEMKLEEAESHGH